MQLKLIINNTKQYKFVPYVNTNVNTMFNKRKYKIESNKESQSDSIVLRYQRLLGALDKITESHKSKSYIDSIKTFEDKTIHNSVKLKNTNYNISKSIDPNNPDSIIFCLKDNNGNIFESRMSRKSLNDSYIKALNSIIEKRASQNEEIIVSD